MSRLYRLKSVQRLPTDLKTAWQFFSNPNNLLGITPPSLNLKVTNELKGDETYTGQIITYTVRPLFGIPLSWMTEITHVEPLKMFVDEQKKGPYQLWHHQHHFTSIEGGVEMTDLVHYRLPFGVLGNVGHAIIVKKKLTEIFTYRYYKVNEIFGDWPNTELELRID